MVFDNYTDPSTSPNNMSPRSDLTSLTSPGSTPERHTRKSLLSIHSTSSVEDNDKLRGWQPDDQPHITVRNMYSLPSKTAPLNIQRQPPSTSNGGRKTVEEEQAAQLRRDIALEERSIAKLERLAEELPNLRRVTKGRRLVQHIIHHSQTGNDESLAKHSGSSKVIIDLQSQIDGLNHQLTEVTEVANEGLREKSALRKKLELMDASVESVKHQNKMLNQLLDRKERRITELENQSDSQRYTLKDHEKKETELTSENQQLNQQLNNSKQEISRLESSYKTLVESTKSLKFKHETDLEEIRKHLSHLTMTTKKDKSRISNFEDDISQQKMECKSLKILYKENESCQQERFDNLSRLLAALRRSIDEKDNSIEEKMVGILAEFERFKSYDPRKHI